MNPQILMTLTLLQTLQDTFTLSEDVSNLFIQYEGKEPSVLIYSDNNPQPKEVPISLDTFCKLCSLIIDKRFTVGTDFNSIHLEHRHIKDIRIGIPDDIIIVSYDDESASEDFSENFACKMRNCFQISGSRKSKQK